ncbi:pyridoxal phosphate-dependent aminotransferase [Carboxylicivirga caseinilyticus]|uniref:pyridoxal phosphate-dependent aminotransferase n=1 Tax=Carboxylicivirga caseinilyticus TaxID=3417572 RepID=UPI003D343793|nr:pyridoxal phosphate-dependent aminotransferase [Marinilabiliaceae bacterium A049]
MSIDERLANTSFPLPAIRQVNMAKHQTGISLGLGELKGFEIDERIKQSMTASWGNGAACYTQNAGLPQLRSAVAQHQQKEDGYNYTVENVIVTIGVQNAVYSSIKTLAKLGAKRVLIPSIHFGIYKKIPSEFGLEVNTYPLNDDFSINLKELEILLQKDDVMILNSPSNPTGKVYSKDELISLSELLKYKLTDGYVISDEIYGQLVYDGEEFTSFSKYFDRTIVVDGISKSGAVAGLRVGWVVTQNEKLAKAITSNNATVISTPPTPNQWAAIPVVNSETKNTIEKYNKVLLENRDKVAFFLEKMNIPFNKPNGSFYIFPKVSSFLGDRVKEFCIETAGKENGVVVIPGVAFGAPEYLRISLASFELEEGLVRLEKALKEWK